jgi:hypothetical protein
LEEVIDLGHPLVRLAREIDWQFLDGRFSSVCTPREGRPPLPTRLMAGCSSSSPCTTFRTRGIALLCHFPIHHSPLLPQAARTPGQRFDQSDGELTADACD